MPAASLVQLHDQVGILCLKVGRRIVECQVAVLADAGKHHVNWCARQCASHGSKHFCHVSRSIDKVVRPDSGPVDEVLAQVTAKAGGVALRYANVLVEMEEFDPRPVDCRLRGELLQEFKLGGTRRGDDPDGAALADDSLKRLGGVLCGGGAHGAAIRFDSYFHD